MSPTLYRSSVGYFVFVYMHSVFMQAIFTEVFASAIFEMYFKTTLPFPPSPFHMCIKQTNKQKG